MAEMNNLEQNKLSEKEIEKLVKERKQQAQNQLIEEQTIQSQEFQEPKERKSLGKIDITKNQPSLNVPDQGWKIIPIQDLPSRGLFYVDNMKIYIRAATVKEIRHFSTIEENDPLDADDKLNYILDNCTKVVINDMAMSYKDILDIDRFYILLSIRDLTFYEPEQKLQMQINCNNCGNVDKIEINREKTHFFKLDPLLQKLIRTDSSGKKYFLIQLKTGESWPLYLTTLGVSNFIKNQTRMKLQKNQYIDRFYLRYCPFLFPDWRLLDEKTFNEKELETYNWGHRKISLMNKIVSLIENSINTDIKHFCTKCGTEVVAPLSFQGGIKSLFLYNEDDILSDLLV